MWKFLTSTWDSLTSTVGSAYDKVTEFVGDTYDDYFTDYSQDSMANYFTPDRGSSIGTAAKTALDFAGGFLAVAAPDEPIDHAQAKLRSISGRSTLRTPKFKAGSSDLGFTPRINDAIMRVNAGDNPSIKALVEQMRIYNGSGRTINLANYSKISVGTKTKKPSFAPKYYGGK